MEHCMCYHAATLLSCQRPRDYPWKAQSPYHPHEKENSPLTFKKKYNTHKRVKKRESHRKVWITHVPRNVHSGRIGQPAPSKGAWYLNDWVIASAWFCTRHNKQNPYSEASACLLAFTSSACLLFNMFKWACSCRSVCSDRASRLRRINKCSVLHFYLLHFRHSGPWRGPLKRRPFL